MQQTFIVAVGVRATALLVAVVIVLVCMALFFSLHSFSVPSLLVPPSLPPPPPLLLLCLKEFFISETPKHQLTIDLSTSLTKSYFLDRCCFLYYLRISYWIFVIVFHVHVYRTHTYIYTHTAKIGKKKTEVSVHCTPSSSHARREKGNRNSILVVAIYVPEPNSGVLQSFIIYFNQSTVALSCTFHFVNVFSESRKHGRASWIIW